MNAEIYFPRNGKAFGQTSETSFENTIKKLGELNVNIIYKTEINLTEDSITEALKVSDSGDERIGMIFIADALSEDDPEKAKEFFESIGIIGKVRRIEADCIDPENIDTASSSASSESGGKKKKKKKKKKKSAEEPSEPIDISQVQVSVAKTRMYAYAAEYNNKLIALLPKHDVLDTSFCQILYTAAKKLVAPKKKKSFWKRFIPCAGDRPIDVIRKIILILAICTFVVSSYMLLSILVIEPAENDRKTNDIKSLLVSTTDGEDKSTRKPKDGSGGVLADFVKLLETNPDTVGWIKVPNTVIDYVVVQSPYDDDPEYYLYRDFYGDYSKYGTVFMDYRSALDSKNMILHGHHMQDGRMFANIVNFSDLDVYKKTPTFTFNTLYEKSEWKIISIFTTNTLEEHGPFFNYLRGSFSSDYDFLNFVYELRERSIIDCPVDLNENDTLVTLSTCTYDFEDFRFVVVARKVRDGEDASVNVSKAKYNDDPVYPQVWYNTYGGTRPETTSFQDAYNSGKIKWYDGKGKWSEKDDEELQRLLTEGKNNAEKMLRDSYKEKDYDEEHLAEIEAIIENYMEKINEADRASDVNDLYAEALAEINKVKTKKQLKEDEESRINAEISEQEESARIIEEAKAQAKADVQNSVAGNEYRLTQAEQVNKVIDKYAEMIDNAETIEEIEVYKEAGIEELAKIKTNTQMNAEESSAAEASRKASEAEASKKAEEEAEASRRAAEAAEAEEQSRRAAEAEASEALEQYKSDAVTELNGYVDESEYSGDALSEIQSIIDKYTSLINDASSEGEINGYLDDAKGELYSVSPDTSEEESEITDESGTEDEESVDEEGEEDDEE